MLGAPGIGVNRPPLSTPKSSGPPGLAEALTTSALPDALLHQMLPATARDGSDGTARMALPVAAENSSKTDLGMAGDPAEGVGITAPGHTGRCPAGTAVKTELMIVEPSGVR